VPTNSPAPSLTPIPTPSLTPIPTPSPSVEAPAETAIVRIGQATYRVDLAVSEMERAQGLSGRPDLGVDAGMLFVYESDAPRTFWMPDMHFPLDMVWIKSDCTVSGVSSDVPNPPPATPRNELLRYPSTEPVRFVLEINAGQAAAQGVTAGTRVEFDGKIAGNWGC
jgi:uncharacterized membrane protein (UPF0127 family)